MGDRLQPGRSGGVQLPRLLRTLIDRTAKAALDPTAPTSERVRAARQGCKQVRAALLLLPAELADVAEREATWFRDAARRLAGWRDADALVSGWDVLLPPHGEGQPSPASRLVPCRTVHTGGERRRLRNWRNRLIAHRRRIWTDEQALEQALRQFTRELDEAKARLAGQRLAAVSFAEIAEGFERTYREVRRSWQRVKRRGKARDFHRWRKWIKRHGIQCCWLQRARPERLKQRVKQAVRLSDVLGAEHDLTMLRGHLRRQEGEGKTPIPLRLRRLIRKRRNALRRQARRLGRRFCAETPAVLVKSVAKGWARQ